MSTTGEQNETPDFSGNFVDLSRWLPAGTNPSTFANIHVDAPCSHGNIHQHFHSQPDTYFNVDANRHAYSRPDEYPVYAYAGLPWQ